MAPAIDYASNTWLYSTRGAIKGMERAQKTGAQAVISSFRIVSLAIVEAEAGIRPIHQRLQERATKLVISIQTLLEKHPLAKQVTRRTFKRFPSPLQKTVQLYKKFDIETIHVFLIPPWEERLQIIIEKDP